MGNKNYILFFLIIIFTLNLNSQDFVFEHYTVDDGLSQSAINSIFQSSDGFLWFATQEGLNRFDGYSFKYYNHDPIDKNSLTSNWVWSIAEDKQGNIWVATQNGLNKINRYTNKITRYVNNPKDPNSLPFNDVHAVFIDTENNIWIKTNNLLSKLDTISNTFESFEHDYDYFKLSMVNYAIPITETEGGLWMGSNKGLLFFNKEYKQFKSYRHNSNNQNTVSSNIVFATIQDKEGNLWIATKNGLDKLNLKTQKFTHYKHSETNKNTISSNFVISLCQDHLGYIWAGTKGNGVNRLNPKTGKITRFENKKENNESISYNEIITIFEDKSKNVWFGTNAVGVDKVSLLPHKFKLYKYSNGKLSYNLSSNMIGSVLEYDDNTLWVGTWDAGLNILNIKTGRIRLYNTESPVGEKIVGNNIHAILRLKNGNILIGTRNGISIFINNIEMFYDFEEYYGLELSSLKGTRIYSMIEDKHGSIWVGSANGLQKINIRTKETIIFKSDYKDSTTISNDQVNVVAEDSEGLIWAGTQNGLNRLNPKTHHFTRFLSNMGGNTFIKDNTYRTISSNTIYSIFEDKQGFLWLGTVSGINKYDKIKGVFRYYTKKHGLPNETVYELIPDAADNIWFSTNRGIGVLNTETDSIKSFDRGDGLQGLEFNNGASSKSSNGIIYFGGVEGLNSFDPNNMVVNPNIPNIVFESYEKTTNKGLFSTNLIGTDTIYLNYDDKSIKIYFASLEYTNPKKNQYVCKLEGFDDNWINTGNQPFKTFSSLPPGTYLFRLKGSNNDLKWSTEINLTIIVKPPLYTTYWAYFLYILFVFLVVYSIVRNRTSKLKSTNQVLRQQQTAALEIKKQKEELDVLIKNIKDSITYAERIQKAMMPSEFLIKKLLNESFVLYKPKDIVSGDFYWIAEKEDKIFIAAVDCTGHGVPGAFMSIIGFDLLRNITREQKIEDPAEILNRLSQGVSDTFSKNIGGQSVKDGMDMALVVLDKTTNTLEYAGALNPLYVVRDGEIIEIKGNRFSIGSVENDDKFDKHKVALKKNDMVYIFSDGYADQFGGTLGKKYKFRRFRHTLLTISNMPVIKQKSFLNENIENWMGDLEQVDDILIIGFRI